MTCTCPPRMCYFRADCRLAGHRPVGRPPGTPVRPTGLPPLSELKRAWLQRRHDELVDAIERETRPMQLLNKRQALAAIDAAIARLADLG